VILCFKGDSARVAHLLEFVAIDDHQVDCKFSPWAIFRNGEARLCRILCVRNDDDQVYVGKFIGSATDVRSYQIDVGLAGMGQNMCDQVRDDMLDVREGAFLGFQTGQWHGTGPLSQSDEILT